MRWILVIILVIHGVIHWMGFAKAFGLADLPQLTATLSRGVGVLWLGAGLAHLATAALFVAAPRVWWVAAFVAVVLSQIAIFTAWGDARFGTIANVVVLLAAVYGMASSGPWSFRAEYESAVQSRVDNTLESERVTAEDLRGLPEPVRCFVEKSGALGQPRAHHFSARWKGRIRGGPDEQWMEFTAEQVNFVDEPARFFLMDATRGGLPVDVLHVFANKEASMRVKLLSLFPMVDQRGPQMTRAETVTLLNDMALMAPAALLDPAVEWEAVDERSARARYTVGDNTVDATFVFNESCELVDFVSDDRLAATPDGDMVARRWSTPMEGHRGFGPYHLPAAGKAIWHAPEGEYAYLEAELFDIEVNGEVP